MSCMCSVIFFETYIFHYYLCMFSLHHVYACRFYSRVIRIIIKTNLLYLRQFLFEKVVCLQKAPRKEEEEKRGENDERRFSTRLKLIAIRPLKRQYITLPKE